MDSSRLADRLRSIIRADRLRSTTATSVRLKPDTIPDAATFDVSPANVVSGSQTRSNFEHILGGEWRQTDGLSCFVVERRGDPETRYGRERLKSISARLVEASAEATVVAGGAPAHPPFVFFDLETTGLSGGAGTYAFLVGCGTFDGDGGFVTRQFVLLRHAQERALLRTLAAELSRAGALVTFNGKSFDAPLIETRYLLHRLEWTGGQLPHLDILHPARRFWGHAGTGAAPCSLMALEQHVLGTHRIGDVAGVEIPARYFHFVRTGDAGPLAAVLEHNRLDLLSLAGLTAMLLHLVGSGPAAARHAAEALALGRIYARVGLDGRAYHAYQHAAATSDAGDNTIRIDSLRSLAILSRRRRQYDEAAAYWRQLLEMPACPLPIARQASEALAIHHEHRAHDLTAAREFALQCLTGIGIDSARRPALNQAVQHRLARIERKMDARGRLV